MSEKVLKPCPFCGGKAEMVHIFGRMGVSCSQCDANFRSESICSEVGYDSVIAAWNKRALLKQPEPTGEVADNNSAKLRNLSKIPSIEVTIGDLGVEVLLEIADAYDQLKSQLASSKQEADTMWEGLNGSIAELQAELKIYKAGNVPRALCPDCRDQCLEKATNHFKAERTKDEIKALIEKYGDPQYKTSELALYDVIGIAQQLQGEIEGLRERIEFAVDYLPECPDKAKSFLALPDQALRQKG